VYNIIFLGAPGAGKGTQATRIARKLKLVHLATGDLFRRAVEDNNKLGKKVKKYIEKGELVPDDITIGLMLDSMSRPDTINGVILDGFPRNLEQAIALDKALTIEDRKITKVVFIKVDENELLNRLNQRWVCRNCQTPYTADSVVVSEKQHCSSCGSELYQRPDDNKETIVKRLKVFLSETMPLIKYYEKTSRLVEVDGLGGAINVSKRILSALDLKSVT